MILRYLNAGLRRFGEHPVLPHSRVSWEFYAVVEGQCGLLLEKNEKLPLRESRLWLLPPYFIHGWHGVPGEPCQIVVFHFASVPPVIEEFIPSSPFLECSLSAKACFSLVQIAAELEPEFEHQTSFSSIYFQKAALELTLLVLAEKRTHDLDDARRKNATKVDAALAWYRRHLRDHPDLSEVANSVHTSVSHLRRLFAEVRNQTPSAAMQAVRIEAALISLSQTDAKIDAIAEDCGFGSGSDFCRAFKAVKGCTPGEWRKRVPSYAEMQSLSGVIESDI